VEIARLTDYKNFVGKREREREVYINALVYLKPMQSFENGSDMCGFRSLNSSASKRVLDLLEPFKLTVWKVVVKRVAVVKFRMDNGGCNSVGCSEVKIWADTAKFTDMILARFRKCRDLVREGKVFVKNKAEVPSGVGCSERGVVYFRKLLLSPIRIEQLKVRRLAVIQEVICCRAFRK